MDDDFYTVLGVSRAASAAEIQKAYRALARKNHPDVNPDDKTLKDKFQKIQRAYEVLNDPKKRELYDRYGSSFDAMGGQGPPPGAGGTGPGGMDFDFQQFFGDKFGGQWGSPGGDPGGGSGGFADFLKQFTGGGTAAGGGGPFQTKPTPRRGADLEHEVTVPFNTAVAGGNVELKLLRKSEQTETLSVRIPAGVEDGQKIRLRGQGEAAPKRGTAGDLILTVHVAEHPHYTRRGRDLYVTVPVTLAEAALGAAVDLPTPSGMVELKIPPNTSSGRKLRVKGLGIAVKDTPPGDLYAVVQIVLPLSLDAESQRLVRELAERQSLEPRRDLKW